MEYFIILFLTVLNGFFALSEIALVSTKKGNLEQLAGKGHSGAKFALKLLEKPENFLSAVQVGITLIGVISGAFGGAALAANLLPFVEQFESIKHIAPQISFGIVISIITYLSIVIGELVPKTISLNNPQPIALAVAPVIYYFTKFTYPVVAFLGLSTNLILKVLFIKTHGEQPVSEEELKMMLKLAKQQGVMEANELTLHQNLFRFADRRASQLMTHRADLHWIDLEDSLEETKKVIRESTYTKFLVCDGSIDQPVGMMDVKEFWENCDTPDFNIKAWLEEPLFIPEQLTSVPVLEIFKKEKNYIGLVVDEFGSLQGMITLFDITEAILGELPSDDEDYEPNIQVRDDGSWLVDGTIPLDEFADHFDCEEAHDEKENISTLAGLVLKKIGNVPKVGKKLFIGDFELEVIDMDFTRIDKLLVRKVIN